jgi:hypothetical protein
MNMSEMLMMGKPMIKSLLIKGNEIINLGKLFKFKIRNRSTRKIEINKPTNRPCKPQKYVNKILAAE